MPGAPIRCTHGHHGLACAKALLKHGWPTWREHQSNTMQARPALAPASKGSAGLDLNMPGKYARSTDTMHARPPRARMCKGIAATWLTNMAGARIGYDASAARTGSRKQRHCWAWPKHACSYGPLPVISTYHPPLKMYFRGGRGQVKKIHLPFSKNLIPQDPP